MNPYFQNQQFGYPNQPTYYAYNQNMYPNYGYANPTQSIEAMYTTVQPYNNKQFLLTTFGNKPQYINIFLTLSHQDKLKMYMLMEQKKLYGEMSDRQSYQKILKQIAQKIQNFKLFHQAESHKKSAQDKSRQLESKIDLIVQKTFEKLNLAQNQPKSNQSEKKQQEADEQEQWIQSTQTSGFQKESNNFSKLTNTQSSPQKNNQTKTKENQVINPIFNMFTFDNTMQEAMTHQIGLKTVNELQKKSIWQLQVEQSQIRQSEPNLKQIFKVKSSYEQKSNEKNVISQTNNNFLQNVKVQASNKPLQHMYQSATFPITSASIEQLYRINSPRASLAPVIKTNQQNHLKLQQREQQDFDSFMESNHQETNPIQTKVDMNGILFENVLPVQENPSYYGNAQNINMIYNVNVQSQQIEQITMQQTQNEKQDQDLSQEFQFGQHNQQIHPKIKAQEYPQTEVKNNEQFNTLDYQNILFDSVQIQTPSVSVEFNFLQAITSPSTRFQTNYETPMPLQLNPFQEKQQTGQTLYQSQIFSQNIVTQSQQISQPVTQKNVQTAPLDLIKSTLISHNFQNQEMLKKLKIQLNPGDKDTLLKGLKNRSFECSTQFYLIIINYLRQISLEWSPEYRHLTQQCKIVKQLHQQSERYTAAVDEDQQQKVTLSIRKTKQLLNTIYENSLKTEKYVMNLLDEKCQQKGLLYKFGRILLSSSLSTEIFQKVINQDRKQILKSFNVLYTIEKLSSIVKLKFFFQKLMIYLGQQYEKYKKLEEYNLNDVQNQEQSYPKYVLYVKGLVKISALCQRMISLLKLCCVKTHSNTVKLLKICKDIRVKYSSYDENSKNSTDSISDLQEVIKTNIQRNKSVYDLHSGFFTEYKARPVCGLCLRQIKNDGNLIQEIYYHYSCFNLSRRLQKEIEYFTQ